MEFLVRLASVYRSFRSVIGYVHVLRNVQNLLCKPLRVPCNNSLFRTHTFLVPRSIEEETFDTLRKSEISRRKPRGSLVDVPFCSVNAETRSALKKGGKAKKNGGKIQEREPRIHEQIWCVRNERCRGIRA